MRRLGRRRLPRKEIGSWELLKTICKLSREMRRQIGLLIDRRGEIHSVSVGDHGSVRLPDKLKLRDSPSRLSGYRMLHTSLRPGEENRRNLAELSVRRLDLLASVASDEKGFPGEITVAFIAPDPKGAVPIETMRYATYQEVDLPFDDWIKGIEEEHQRTVSASTHVSRENRAILCAVATPRRPDLEEELEETAELARSVGLEVLDSIIQTREKIDPKTYLGFGKLEQVTLRASQLDAQMLLFHDNLSPGQALHLSNYTNLRILDRTQLILDIFAQRAKSHDGKLQVELAQLRYTLPRLRERESSLSRLVGGIGGRGPGETKLEIHRRRARDRINRLEKEIDQIARKRSSKRTLRGRRNVPVVSIVGYTNAGKSTLLNTLTKAEALVEDKPFATLDPFSKRLRFPRDRELILTDTVGFIRDLPPDLITAFRATLEEIGEADLLLHVVDLQDPRHEEQIKVVNELLSNLGYADIPRILVLNKADTLNPGLVNGMARHLEGLPISARQAETCRPLLNQIETKLWQRTRPETASPTL